MNPSPKDFPQNNLGMMINRRHFIFSLAGLLGAQGCSYSPLVESTTKAINVLIDGYPDVVISRQQVNSLPYATIGVKIGDGPRSLLVLGRKENNDLHWISADKAVILTRGGHIVRTVGLGTNLRGTRFREGLPLMPVVDGRPKTITCTREIDIEKGNLYDVKIQSTFQFVEREKIRVLDINYSTLKIYEHAQAPEIGWQYTNIFWVSPENGFIWRSVQNLMPSLPPAIIEVFKSAA